MPIRQNPACPFKMALPIKGWHYEFKGQGSCLPKSKRWCRVVKKIIFKKKDKTRLYILLKKSMLLKRINIWPFRIFCSNNIALTHTHVYTPSLWPSNPNPNIIPRPVIFISAKNRHTHKQALIFFSRYYTYPDILTSNGRKQHFSVQKCHDRINSHASHFLWVLFFFAIESCCKVNEKLLIDGLPLAQISGVPQ